MCHPNPANIILYIDTQIKRHNGEESNCLQVSMRDTNTFRCSLSVANILLCCTLQLWMSYGTLINHYQTT